MRPIVARDLMTPEILSVRGDWSFQEAARYLVDHEISGAVVRDDAGEMTGVVSLTDIASATAENGSRIAPDRSRPNFYTQDWDEKLATSDLTRMRFTDCDRTVHDVMTPEVFAVDASTTASEIAATMLEAHIHRVLVEENGELVGVISTSDLLGLLLEE